MSITRVIDYLQQFSRDEDILTFPVSSATVELAAQALGAIPARIAKTLSFYRDGGCILIVTAGDAKVNNSRFKAEFGIKPKMLAADDVLPLTGHEIGGVCPFANPETAQVYLDISLQRFDRIYPACGSSNSAIGLTCDELAHYSKSIRWVDACKGWQEELPLI